MEKYLDFVQGIAVNSLGHANKIYKAITNNQKNFGMCLMLLKYLKEKNFKEIG